jgi:hypothetical protein
MAGVKHSTSADSSFTSAGAAAWEAEHVLSGVAEQSAVDVISLAVAGALSVMAINSAQMTSADNAISNAVSVVSVAAANALSVANAASNKASALSVAIAANSAQMTSADNAISNAVSVVSVAAANALSVANAASNKASALSVAIAANSAQMTSADNAISAAAAAVSADLTSVKAVVSNQGSAINAVSNRLSTWAVDNLVNVSAPTPNDGDVLKYRAVSTKWVASADNTGGGGGSVTSAEVNAVSVAAASAAATLSAAIEANSAQMTSADNAISNAVSVVSVAAANALSVANAASNKASALSVAIATNSAQMTSADNAISAAAAAVSADLTSVKNVVSDLRSDHIVLSDVVSGWATSGVANQLPKRAVMAGDQIVSATALVSVSGLNFSVAAGSWYRAEWFIYTSSPTSLAMPQFAISAPFAQVTGYTARYQQDMLQAATQITTFVSQGVRNSALVTVLQPGVRRANIINAMFFASAGGTLNLNIGNNVSGGAIGSSITVIAGSHGFIWRMA